MRILILTYAFPPLNRIASSRPYSWARYWSRLGHEVTVLTKDKTAADGPLNLEYDAEELKDVKVIELKAWPFRLKRPAEEGLAIEKGFFRNLSAYFAALRVLTCGDFWGLSVVRKISGSPGEFYFDAMVSTFGPNGAHIVAAYLKRKFNIFWLADYRDLWHGNHARPKKGFFDFLGEKLERSLVKRADLITTVSEGLNKKLSKRFNCGVITVHNGFDEEDLIQTTEKERLFPDDGKFRLAYTGSIYEGFQDPSPLFEALLVLAKKGFPVESRIEILFYGSRLANLNKKIKQYNLENVVRTPGFVSRKEALRIQKSADALLFLEWNGRSDEGIITGKLFEYLCSGRPILSVGGSSDNTEPSSLIETLSAGINMGSSPQSIAGIIEAVVSERKIKSSATGEMLSQYSRKYLAEKMLNLIRDQINRSEI